MKYDVTVDGQLGFRYGTLEMEETDGKVSGVLSLLGSANPVHGTRRGNVLELTHDLQTAVSLLHCVTSLNIEGNDLTGELVSAQNRMKFHGVKAAQL